MTLPKKRSRKITHNGKKYRWIVGKIFHTIEGIDYANVYVEFPDKNIGSFEVCMGDEVFREKNPLSKSVTPNDVRNFIEEVLKDK